jgi:hypothetical protein
MRAAEGVLGALLVLVSLLDLFRVIITPRAVRGRLRISRYLNPGLWTAWRWAAFRLPARYREDLLGSFGPLSLVLLLIAWVALLLLGYGLLLDAFRSEIRPEPHTLTTSLYVAGTSMLTIGFGDFVPTHAAARAVALAAGATGLATFALVVTFLFSLFQSFQRREAVIVATEAAAGAPPSGVTLLETFGRGGVHEDLAGLFRQWQLWSAEVLDSHLSFPVLTYFRSSHDNDSWITSLGAMMDAASLVVTTIEDGPTAWAKMFRWVRGHCLEDITQYFRLEDEHYVGVELEEYREARRRLAKAGWTLRDEEESWAAFQRVRSEYAGRVNAMASHWASPPAQWIGDRSVLRFGRHAARVGPGPID